MCYELWNLERERIARNESARRERAPGQSHAVAEQDLPDQDTAELEPEEETLPA